jgi:hypothetical protein
MTAARYQIIIMYLISGSACGSTVAASLMCIHAVTDSEHRVRSERIIKRGDDGGSAFFGKWIDRIRNWRRTGDESVTPLASSQVVYGALNGRR